MTDKTKLVSIIVPVYNVEKYLANCIDSIISQSYSNIEVILVDDGSQDLSPQICDNYLMQDSRVVVLHLPNGGVAQARQSGFECAKGEYMMFVDSDDWMLPNAVQTLCAEMSDDIDIVIGSFKRYTERTQKYRIMSSERALLSTIDYLKGILLGNVSRTPWAKLYRRELFTSDAFPHIKRSQDIAMNVEIACRCRAVKCIPECVYIYRRDSTTSTITDGYQYNKEFCIHICTLIYNELSAHSLYDEVKAQYARFAFRFYKFAIQAGAFDDSNPVVLDRIKENIDINKLSRRERVYLRSFDSTLIRCGIRSKYFLKLHFKMFKKRMRRTRVVAKQ